MKAISPALPMTTPSRQSNGADASAADEAFSALIAAVIGAPATPSAPSVSPSAATSRSTARVDKTDDARPAAATSRATRATHEASDAATDQTDSANSSDQTQAPDATQRAIAKQSDNQQKPGSAPSPSAPRVSSAPSAADLPKVPAGLEKAAAALAQALAAAGGDTLKAGPSDGLPTAANTQALPVVNPGTALTEGQLPTQLVAAITVAPTPTTAALLIGTPDVKPGDNSAGKAAAPDEKKPTQSAPPVTPPTAAVSPVAAMPVSTQVAQSAQPEASSDAKASPAAISSVANPSEHAKAGEQKPAAQDQQTQGAAPTSRFDAQLSAQAPTPPPQAPQVTTVIPVQQSQSTYSSSMVSQQIVQVVAPLRTAKDGDYTLSLQLHPADLGAVTVRVEVQQGVLSVHMSAEHAHGHEALNQSLADLRTQLQTSGVRTGDIVVSAKPSVMPQHQEQQQHTGGRHQQEAPIYDDGTDRRPSDQGSRHAQQQADDDNLDVRI